MRFNLYVSARLDGNYRFSQEREVVEGGNYINYGIFLGTAYYFGRHWGAFFEYGFSNSYNLRYGLALKF